MNSTHKLFSVSLKRQHTPLWGAAHRLLKNLQDTWGLLSVSDGEHWHRASPLTSSCTWPLSQQQDECSANMKSDIRPFIQRWHLTRGSNQCSASYLKMGFIMSDVQRHNDASWFMQINFSWRILEEKKGRSQAAVSIAHQGRRTRLVCFRGIYKTAIRVSFYINN